MNSTLPAARPRIALFCDEEGWGGIVTYCIELARSLAGLGFEVTLYAPIHQPWHDVAAGQGVTVQLPRDAQRAAVGLGSAPTVAQRRVPTFARLFRTLTPRSIRWLLGSYREYRMLRQLFEEVPADLIHVQSAGGEVAAVAARHRRPRVPVVSTLHFPPSMVSPQRLGSLVWRFVCRMNMRAFDRGIAVSRATLADWDAITGVSLKPPRGSVVYNGSASSSATIDREEARRILDIPTGACVLLNVAALMEYKDQAQLLSAVRLLIDGGDDVLLVVAGEGPSRSHLEGQVRELQLEQHVRLLGHRSDTGTLFAAADLYIQSSRDEAFPMVLLEAGLHGLPIVATDVGGVGELITEGVSGTLVPPGNAAALAHGVRTVLRSHDFGAGHARELSETIRASFLAEHMVRETAAVYRELLPSPTPATA